MDDVAGVAEFRGHRVLLRSNCRAPVEWLCHFGRPFFEVKQWPDGAPAPAGEVVALYGDMPSLEARGRAWARGRGRRLRLYLGRRGRCWRLLGGPRLVVEDGADPAVYLVAAGRTVMFGRAGSRHHVQQPARLVREALLGMALADDGLKLHGAAVVVDDRAVLILGAKGAGKTTLALRLAQAGALCANDRVLVFAGGGGAEVFGLPISARVGAGTALALGRFGELFRPGPAREALCLAQPGLPCAPPPGGLGAKVELSPHELSSGLGVPLRPAAPLGAVVVARLRSGRAVAAGARVAIVPGPARRRHLARALLWPDPAFPPCLFRPAADGPAPARPAARRRKTAGVRRLAARPAWAGLLAVPWLEARGALGDAGAASRVLAAIRQAMRH